jgi:hypothetical protein
MEDNSLMLKSGGIKGLNLQYPTLLDGCYDCFYTFSFHDFFYLFFWCAPVFILINFDYLKNEIK